MIGKSFLWAGVLGAMLAQPAASLPVEVKLVVKALRPTHVELVACLKNNGKDAVYAVTDTTLVDGRRSSYISQEGDSLVLQPLVFKLRALLYQNDSRVKLERVAPGQELVREFTLRFPLAKTQPPYDGVEEEFRHPIARADFKRVVVRWGVFPASSALLELMGSHLEPGTVDGFDTLPSGEELLTIQSVASASIAVP